MTTATISAVAPALDAADQAALARAVRQLERPGLAIRLAETIGRPIEAGLEFLPRSIADRIGDLSRGALEHAYRAAILRMHPVGNLAPSSVRQRAIVAASGAIGGAGGLIGLPFELPITTVAIMAEIAAHARAQGEDLRDPRTRAECVAVFGLGRPGDDGDDAADTGYFALRHALASQVTAAARAAAARRAGATAGREVAPGMLRLIHAVGQRFGVAVGEKAAAQAVPLLGALAGASINVVFIDHYRAVADGHFTVRRLERRYGEATVREHYRRLLGVAG